MCEADLCYLDIAERLGTPDLALLPISVGGALQYMRSLDPAPAGYALVPEIPDALTSSTHMSPGDAVDLHRLLLGERVGLPVGDTEGDDSHSLPPLPGRKRMISMAIHFGTFCSGPAESRDTVRTLRRECNSKGVSFMKVSRGESVIEVDQESAFVVVDHGGSVEVAVQ
jgi:N-acyl-phosphatidylethanolamine-hydrolysing phospholipase D